MYRMYFAALPLQMYPHFCTSFGMAYNLFWNRKIVSVITIHFPYFVKVVLDVNQRQIMRYFFAINHFWLHLPSPLL